jgi:hypothetical protein
MDAGSHFRDGPHVMVWHSALSQVIIPPLISVVLKLEIVFLLSDNVLIFCFFIDLKF